MGNVMEKKEGGPHQWKRELEAKAAGLEPGPEPAKKLKPCCACPETKRPRDACIIEKGEENCGDLIEAHKECMRKAGFKI